MNKLLSSIALSGLLLASPASANFDVTVGSGTHIFAIDAANLGTSGCAAASVECPSSVLVDTTGAAIGVTGNHLFATISGSISNTTFGATLNATPSLANGNGVVPTQGGAILSATNGIYANNLQGNAVLSATNGLFENNLQGNAVLSVTNPLFAAITDGTTKAAVDVSTTGLKVYLAGGASGIINNNGGATIGNSSPVTPSNQPVGSAAMTPNQISCPITTATQSVAARTGIAGVGRVSVTITNITGTQPIFIGNTGVTVSTGDYIPAIAGASKTINTQAAIFCIASTAAQTISFLETE